MSLLLPPERRPAPSTLQVYGNSIFLRNTYCLLNGACEVFCVTLTGGLVPAHPPQVVFGGIVSTVLFSVCFLGVERFDGCEEAVLGWLCMCSG